MAPKRPPVDQPIPVLTPPLAYMFPKFNRPLYEYEKDAKEVTRVLRAVLRIFYHKQNGAFGVGENPWWEVKVPTSGLTSRIAMRATEGMDEFAPSDILPWHEVPNGSKFHNGPG